MIEIISKLFISSLIEANDISILNENSINVIISIGCIIDEKISNDSKFKAYSYPNILDIPSQLIIPILLDINKIISQFISESNILVHCVYGQSRSAAGICYYLMKNYNDLSIFNTESNTNKLYNVLIYMKSKHNCICINPGFTAQLYYLYNLEINNINPISSAYYRNILYTNEMTTYNPVELIDVATADNYNTNILCKNCRIILNNINSIIQLDITFENDIKSFVERHIDDYWKNYNCNNNKSIVTISKNILILDKSQWLKSIIISNDNSIQCPSCFQKIGLFKSNGLQLCGGFLKCDLLYINKSNITMRKQRL